MKGTNICRETWCTDYQQKGDIHGVEVGKNINFLSNHQPSVTLVFLVKYIEFYRYIFISESAMQLQVTAVYLFFFNMLECVILTLMLLVLIHIFHSYFLIILNFQG